MTSLPRWTYSLVGIPYLDKGRGLEGCDCWGIVRLAHERMGTELASYSEDYASAREMEEVASLIAGEKGGWDEVELDEAKLGDVLIFSRVAHTDATHVGLVLGEGLMLHMRFGRKSTVETYLSKFWRNRLEGIYRHE